MRRLAPYQTGLWLAEYLNVRCQLCRVCRSSASIPTPHQLSAAANTHSTLTHSPLTPSNSKWHARLAQRINRGLLCVECHTRIMWLPPAFYIDIASGVSMPIQAASYYDYPMRQAIRSFKHSEDMTKLPLLVHALRQLPRPSGCHHGNSVIIAMPTTDNRLVKRGFDPVTILSLYLSKHWQIPLWHGVARVDQAVSQQGLSRAERLSNLDNAFMLTEIPKVKNLLLLDDVATTGASLRALACALYSQSHAIGLPTKISNNSPKMTTHPHKITAYALAHGSYERS